MKSPIQKSLEVDLTRRMGIIPCGYDVVKHLYEKKPLAVGSVKNFSQNGLQALA